MKYVVVVEKTPNNLSAFVPDLPGCVAAAETHEEITTLIHEAIKLHLQGMQEEGIAPLSLERLLSSSRSKKLSQNCLASHHPTVIPAKAGVQSLPP